MPKTAPLPSFLRPAPDPRLTAGLLHWLACGVLLVLALPAARGASGWFGSLPFWLVLAPLAALLTHHRHALAAAWRAHLVRTTPRRRRRPQARRAPRAGNARKTGVFSPARRGAFAPAGAGTRT